MVRFERLLLLGVVAFATVAFAQHGGSHGGGMGADHGMSGSHDMGSPNSSASAGHGSSSLASQSPDNVLSHNTAIAGKIQSLTGMDAKTACSGFKNLGQCVAAAHVSKNLDISFDDLKAKMTGSGSESLGKAIKDLKPSADAKAEAKKANKQANHDLQQSSS